MVSDNGLVQLMRLAGLEHYAKQGEEDSGVSIQLRDPEGNYCLLSFVCMIYTY